MKSFMKALLALIAAIFLFLFARSHWYAAKGILVTFGYTLLFTLSFTPLCARLERAGATKGFAAGFVVLMVPFIILLILTLIFPRLVNRFQDLASRCIPVLQSAALRAEGLMENTSFRFFDLSSLIDGAAAGLSKAAGMVARRSLSFAAEAGRMLFSLIISYYILKERVVIGNYLLLLVPSGYRQAVLLTIKACNNAVMGYFCGMMKTGLFVGTATGIGLFVLGVADALLLGLMMGILEMLPYIGPLLGSVPILLSALPLGLNHTILALLLVILIQQTESSFIGPLFTASSTAIRPLTALLSTYVFSAFFGFWGIILAVPVIVMLRSMMWSYTQFRNQVKA